MSPRQNLLCGYPRCLCRGLVQVWLSSSTNNSTKRLSVMQDLHTAWTPEKAKVVFQLYFFFKNGATQLWSDSPQLLYSTVGSIIQEEHGQAAMHPE